MSRLMVMLRDSQHEERLETLQLGYIVSMDVFLLLSLY